MHRDLDTLHISSLQDISQNSQHFVTHKIHFLPNKNTNRPHLHISASHKGFVGLYDTGADICCFEQQAFDRIPTHFKPKVLNTKPGIFKASNGGLLQTHGRYLITIPV